MRKPDFGRSVQNALNGILKLVFLERNFQLETLAFAVNLALIFFLEVKGTDAAILILVSFVVLITEAINTVIEKLCDFIFPEFDERIGTIKDIAAGAVLLAVFAALSVALVIYPAYIFS